MLRWIKNFWNELLSIAKTWPVRRQMLFCYLVAIFAIISMIMILVILNLTILVTQTALRVEETRDEQAKQDMLDLVKSGASTLYSEIFGTVVFLDFISEMLVDMFREETFSLEPLKAYTYWELPSDCLKKQLESYGEEPVCLEHSTYLALGEVDQELLNKTSRFDNIWKTTLDLTKSLAIRYLMYIESGNYLVVYPGSLIPNDYSPKDTVWYKAFEQFDFSVVGSTPYMDDFGSNQNITSIVYPLLHKNGTRIGTVSVDIPVENLYKRMSSIKFLGSGHTSIIHREGDILRTKDEGWWSTQYRNIQEIPYQQYWENVQKDPMGVYFLIENEEIYRVASKAFSYDLNPGNDWWYLVVLVVNEADIMVYKEEAKQTIQDGGDLLILTTLVCSLVATAIIIWLIHLQSKVISEPLTKIYNITMKMNQNGEETNFRKLDKFEKYPDQIARLVKAYRYLIQALNTQEEGIHGAISQKPYPPNELYNCKRVSWKDYLSRLPN